MVVVRRTYGGSYRLAELDGAVGKSNYAAFRLVPYFPRTHISIPLDRLIEPANGNETVMTELNGDDAQAAVYETPVSAGSQV